MRKYVNQILFSFTLFLFLAFTFTGNPPSNWNQQSLPDINGRSIIDIKFLDSLTGYISTSNVSDTSFILKTTNAGNNWSIKFRTTSLINKFQFLNNNTGFLGGIDLFKTTNGGENWFVVHSQLYIADLAVLNEDTLWYADSESLEGGIFCTTNGGSSWIRQMSAGSNNPDKIYMYNNRIGFATESNIFVGKLYRTSNSGVNWTLIQNEGFL